MKKQKDIKHIWNVIAQSSLVEQETNNISILKVLEQLNVNLSVKDQEWLKNNPGKAVLVPFPFQIISLWQSINPKKDPMADVEIEFFDPIGLSLQNIKFKLQFEAKKTRMRSITTSPIVSVIDTGVYLFKIRIKEEEEDSFLEVAEIPIEVRITKEI
jgi:hypothetical protein